MQVYFEDDARQTCESAGLNLVVHNYYHWQILGGSINPLVNFWPHGKRGSKIALGHGKGRPGNLGDAIALAGPNEKTTKDEPAPVSAPWEKQPRSVGVIRRFWRWLW